MLQAQFPKLFFFFATPREKKTEKYAPTYLSEQRTVAIICFSRKKKLSPFVLNTLFTSFISFEFTTRATA